MTIITKAISDKKKLDKQPLVTDDLEAVVAPIPPVVVEGSEEPTHVFLTFPSRTQRRLNTTTTVCVFLMALLVLSVGIIGGIYLYRQYAHAKMHKYRSWCNVPYEGDVELHSAGIFSNPLQQDGYGSSKENDKMPSNFFKEDFEIDLDYEAYEQIDVPDFRGGRRGRFIHDFSANKTGIIDLEGRRCFVMPLNRSQVLPPHSLFDLVLKMKAGYYEVDTEVVRETMRVVQPPLSDLRKVGYYIARECATLPTYMMKRVTSPVYKRSISNNNYLFTEFAGKKIVQIHVLDWVENDVSED